MLSLARQFKLLLILVLLITGQAAVSMGDRLLVKVESKTYFLSEVNALTKDLKLLKCLGSSYMSKALKIEESKLLKTDLKWLKENREMVIKRVQLLKVVFAAKDKVKQLERKKQQFPKACRNAKAKNSLLWEAELYLRERFTRSNGEIASMDLFMQSLSEKYHHRLYF